MSIRILSRLIFLRTVITLCINLNLQDELFWSVPGRIRFGWFCGFVSADVCQPNPCMNGGKCVSSPSDITQDYQCMCQYPTGGRTCQFDLVCDKCARQGNLILVIPTTKTMIWSEAKKACMDLNLTLFTPRTDAQTAFGQTFLNQLFSKNPEGKNAAWIRVSRDETQAGKTYGNMRIITKY